VRKLKEAKPSVQQEFSRLDLSSVRTIINGAEPITHSVVREFLAVFGKHCRLPSDCMACSYGLAENTVFACSSGTLLLQVDKSALENNDVVVVQAQQYTEDCTYLEGTVSLVSIGNIVSSRPRHEDGVYWAIVDPETFEELPPNRVS
jgi:acyl-CoA synthetase (AMP-forming)/AMP-acid ligase II